MRLVSPKVTSFLETWEERKNSRTCLLLYGDVSWTEKKILDEYNFFYLILYEHVNWNVSIICSSIFTIILSIFKSIQIWQEFKKKKKKLVTSYYLCKNWYLFFFFLKNKRQKLKSIVWWDCCKNIVFNLNYLMTITKRKIKWYHVLMYITRRKLE